MSNNQKRIDQLKLEMQVAVDEYNKIQEKIKELKGLQEIETTKTEPVN